MTTIVIPDDSEQAVIETDSLTLIRKLEGYLQRYPKYVRSDGETDGTGPASRWVVHRDMIGVFVPMWLAWDHA